MLDIGVTLRRYRDKYSYTQQYAADIIGISRVAYRKWENNEVDFHSRNWAKLQTSTKFPFRTSSLNQPLRKLR